MILVLNKILFFLNLKMSKYEVRLESTKLSWRLFVLFYVLDTFYLVKFYLFLEA